MSKEALGWQPIETAPRDGRYIIIGTTCPGYKGQVFFDWFYEGGEWGDESDIAEDILRQDEFVSHWMPLPEPPAMIAEGE